MKSDKVELSTTKDANQTPETKMLSAVNKILDEGSAKAREIAKANLAKIKKAIGVI